MILFITYYYLFEWDDTGNKTETVYYISVQLTLLLHLRCFDILHVVKIITIPLN